MTEAFAMQIESLRKLKAKAPRMGISDVHPALVASTCFLLSAERSWTGERTLSEGEEHWWTEPWRWRSKVCGS